MEGKIFLGGLTWQTTEEMLKTHFGKWGALNDVILMRNKITGEPRGFGFVQFQASTCGSRKTDAGVFRFVSCVVAVVVVGAWGDVDASAPGSILRCKIAPRVGNLQR